MKKLKIKRTLSMLLAFIMAFSILPAALAADMTPEICKTDLMAHFEDKGITVPMEAVGVLSLADASSLNGLPFNTPYYKKTTTEVSYYSLYAQDSSEGLAALDQMARELNPREFDRKATGTGEIMRVDLIQEMLALQDPTEGKTRNSVGGQRQITEILALEAFFGGQPWGNEHAGTKLGRTGAIVYFLSQIHDSAVTTLSPSNNWSVEGGRVYCPPDSWPLSKSGLEEIGSYFIAPNADAVVLLSRWLNDDTLVTINGESKELSEVAASEIEGILKTLKFFYPQDISDMDNMSSFCVTATYAKYISALVAAGKISEIDNNNLLNPLFQAKEDGENGAYDNYCGGWATEQPNDFTTAYAAIALGDYINRRSMLATLTYSGADMTDEGAVTRDLAAIKMADEVSADMTLTSKGFYGSTITWTSSNAAVINAGTGAVTRPAIGQPNTTVILTATVARGSEKQSKQFTVTVTANKSGPQQALDNDVRALSIPLFVTADITLPSEGSSGSTITWTTSNADVIATNGTVNTGASELEVILTALVKNGSLEKSKVFSVTVGKAVTAGDIVTESVYKMRALYDTKRDLTGNYWDVWAAKSILGDDFDKYNFRVYNVKNHRVGSEWQNTDYGGVILQIVAQGDNPYNYLGTNYVQLLLNNIAKNDWGPYGCPMFAAMALDASGAMTFELAESVSSRLVGETKNLTTYGPDLAAWAMVPVATFIENDSDYINSMSGTATVDSMLQTFKTALTSKIKTTGVQKGLINTATNIPEGTSLTASNGCIVNGAMSLTSAGYLGFDLRTEQDWFAPSLWASKYGIVNGLYDQEVKGKNSFNPQITIAFGDLYYGDSVWRRIAIKPTDMTALLAKAKPLVDNGGAAYTAASYNALNAAYTAANAKKDAKYNFGQEYYTLRDAVENLKPAGSITLRILGDASHETIRENITIASSGTVLEILGAASTENNFSQTVSGGEVTELCGMTVTGNQAWLCYNGQTRIDNLSTYKPAEGAALTFKYCADTTKLAASATLDIHLAQEAADALVIGGLIDASNNVTGNITLPTSGLFGCGVSWLSSKPLQITNDGKVSRDPTYDIAVRLDAQVSGPKGTVVERVYNVVVKTTGIVNPPRPGDNGPKTPQAYISVVDPYRSGGPKTFFAKKAIDIEPGETAYSLLEKTRLKLDVQQHSEYGVYVEAIEGWGEFSDGNQSGWMYRVNGRTAGQSAAKEQLKDGDNVEWLFTRDLGEDLKKYPIDGVTNGNIGTGGGGVGSGGGASVTLSSVVAGASIDINANTPGSDGVSIATIPQDKLTDFITKVKDSTDLAGSATIVNLGVPRGTTGVNFTLPNALLAELAKKNNSGFEIVSDIGIILLDANTIDAIAAAAGSGDVVISIKKADTSNLTEEEKAIIGDHPIYELSIMANEKPLTDFKGGNVIVSLPYTAPAGEDTSKLTVYHLGENNAVTEMKDAAYDKTKKAMIFGTGHFSKFAIALKKAEAAAPTIKFTDVSDSHWAKEYIYYLAGLGIINGTSATTFSPENNITRAEFVAILSRMSGETLPDADETFSDVKSSDWFAKNVMWAYKSGITTGTSPTTFTPAAKITREDMAVMVMRYADYKGMKLADNVQQAASSEFKDSLQIASYAKSAIAAMQSAGIISGNPDGSFAPKDNATRAQAAKIFTMVLQGSGTKLVTAAS